MRLLNIGALKEGKRFKLNGISKNYSMLRQSKKPSINVSKKTLRQSLLTKQKIKGLLMNYAERLNYKIGLISASLLILSLVVACASPQVSVVDLPAKPLPQAPKEIMKPVVPDSLNKLKQVFSISPSNEIKK